MGIDKEIDSAMAFDFNTAVRLRIVYSDIDIKNAERDALDKQREEIEELVSKLKRAR